ncbi:MAG: hypothetical protein RID91_00165 [Azospirillaceae bacterium]
MRSILSARVVRAFAVSRRPADRRTRTGAAGAVLAALVAPAVGLAQDDAPAALSVAAEGWRGGAYARPDTGAFSHCAVARDDLLQGVTLVFARTPAGGLRLGMIGAAAPESSPPWAARLTVDEDEPEAVAATAPDGDGFVLALPDDPALVDSLRLGLSVTVSLDDRSWTFPLRGTNAALGALERCVETAGGLSADRLAALAGSAAPDAATPPGDSAPSAGAPTAAPEEVGSMLSGPEGEIDRAGLTRLLAAAGFDGVAFARQSALPDNALELDHAWQLGNGVVGGLHQHARGDANEFLGFVDTYLDAVREVCPGDADVVLESAERLRERFGLARASVECRAPEGPAFIELFLALDDTNYSAFFHEGGSQGREAPAEATDRIEQVVRQMAGL